MSQQIYSFIFAIFAGLTIASAFCVVYMKNILHAAVSLFFCLASVAALYILLGADFLGVVQLLIYAGGILVLLIFGIFLTSGIYKEESKKNISLHSVVIMLLSVCSFIIISFFILKLETRNPSNVVFLPTTQAIGELLLSKYLLPFELISMLLLFALVGAVLLVRKEVKGK